MTQFNLHFRASKRSNSCKSQINESVLLFCFFLLALLFSCKNSPEKIQSSGQMKADSFVTNVKPALPDTIKKILNFDSVKADVYKFENDTFAQVAYIHYDNPGKIEFLLKTLNKLNKNTAEIQDTAALPGPIGDPDTYEDEKDEKDENSLYPVYEFNGIANGGHIHIGIEPSRGARLSVQVSKKFIQDANCPIASAGTLRRVRLSTQSQEAPHLPRP